MKSPPLGYDDETIIPQQRIQSVLTQLEEALENPRYLQQFTSELPILRASAEEIGEGCSLLVEKLITAYESFQEAPDPAGLDRLRGDIKNLQLMLVG